MITKSLITNIFLPGEMSMINAWAIIKLIMERLSCWGTFWVFKILFFLFMKQDTCSKRQKQKRNYIITDQKYKKQKLLQKKINTDPRPHSQTIGLTLRMLGGWVCLIINKSDNMSLHKNTGHQKMNIGQRPYTALTTHWCGRHSDIKGKVASWRWS